MTYSCFCLGPRESEETICLTHTFVCVYLSATVSYLCVKNLGAELDAAMDPDKVTAFDRLHKLNKAEGKSKFKTLQRIRAGNTRQRILDFESM